MAKKQKPAKVWTGNGKTQDWDDEDNWRPATKKDYTKLPSANYEYAEHEIPRFPRRQA
jgi:hypothetical protein